MKLHRLELAGFGPFRDRQVVDFDAFADDGIFLISGRTGAGKSSVLDGVCFALFGGVPRYDSSDKRLRSDHCAPEDPTEVVLEFTAADRRFKVIRSPEYDRPKRRGGGMTKEAHQARLEELVDGRWSGIAARPVEVAAHLDEIVGLTQQQFLQVILLAQNRFARFLLARNDERQAVLRTLFGTRTYEQYAEILETLRKDTAQAIAADGETVRMLLAEAERVITGAALAADGDPALDEADLRARLDAVVRAVDRAAYRAEAAAHDQEAAGASFDAALAAERELSEVAERQRRRLEVRAELRALEDDAPAVAALAAELARARAAEELRGVLDGAERSAAGAADAAATAEAATAAWAALGETATTPAQLRAREDALAEVIAACAAALEAETALRRAVADHAAAEAAATEAEEAVTALDAQRAAVPAALAGLDEKLTALAGAPAARDAAAARLAEARARAAAARKAALLATALRDAEAAALAAGTALAAATTHHTSLLQRRLAAAAGDLAAGLADGEPCPVCGGTEHPHPAPPAADPVTDADLDDAAAAKEAAWQADRAAGEVLSAARAAHAAAVAQAAGTEAEAAESAVGAAEEALATCERDAAAATRLADERAALAAAEAEAAAAREILVTEAAAARQEAALAAQRAETLRVVVAQGQGDAASIGARRADAEERRDRLRAVREAAAEANVRAQVAADAAAECVGRLAASVFADAAEARAALRDPARRDAMDERVRRHETAERATRERLLELELSLADRPSEPVDLAPARAALAEARERVTATAAALTAAQTTLERLRDLAERADTAHRAVAEAGARAAVVTRLADTVAGRAPNTHRMTLETFVLAAELEEIVAAANLRLGDMSAGRYRLVHSDARAARGAASGLGLDVFDAYTGQNRPPQSLSGGETFLASLSLALGLAEVVTARAGGMRLDTLFIDEGFGSLDDETLDLAMRALDELRQGGRTVGVISHVAAMKEQLPAQLHVEAAGQGPSVIRQDHRIRV